MVLVARLRELAARPVPASEAALMSAMIRQSDNTAANEIYARTGAAAVRELARDAGMTEFTLAANDPLYVLGNSRVSAADQARFFARIDQLLPPAHRSFALDLLSHLEEGNWGILAAGLPGSIASKAGWRPESDGGWTVTQGAQLHLPATEGLSVLTEGDPSMAYGEETIAGVARRLLAVSAARSTRSRSRRARGSTG
jgi:hypothetical protein